MIPTHRGLSCSAMFIASMHLLANTGVGSVKAGGIVLRSERRVAIQREKLFISPKQIRVDYVFFNETAQPLRIPVVFPLPEQRDEDDWQVDFEDFKVRVDGRPEAYHTSIQAFLDGTEVTAQLREAGIRPRSFRASLRGRRRKDDRDDIRRLPEAVRERLAKAGLISDPQICNPQWTIRKAHHWLQTFPARRKLQISHTYRPAWGAQGLMTKKDLLEPEANERQFCRDPDLRAAIRDWRPDDRAGIFDAPSYTYVDYVLTTANTWKTPIDAFELVVQAAPGERASFCWAGPVEKLDAQMSRAIVKGFVPTGELRVNFFQLSKP